ncbi:helix-turn-helix domain-containing protein [Aerosticca soli]|uniref:helix-turn-helix domain-containing protein n=1 Tax=Aerosticca soli TaxID=2010829 RepID=UPI000F82AF5A|nr:helix-turn-helix domain-containing protein [Aerosticca soli]
MNPRHRHQPVARVADDQAPGLEPRPDLPREPDCPSSEAFAQRLRAAREARGLSVETCAQALKLPSRVLRQIESGQADRLDHGVYLAGYIGKYARHLGLEESEIAAEIARIKCEEPPLVATGGISRSRYLLERYATAATYVLLTAVIVAPVIWLGVRGSLDRDASHLAPLDAAPVAQQDAQQGSPGKAANPTSPTPRMPVVEEGQPLLASMAPFPNLDSESPSLARPKPAAENAAPEAAVGGHVLELSLKQASWVEVTDAKGTRLEYGLLPAGTRKSYRSEGPLEVRIGNAEGAEATLDGQPVTLEPYRHANVAHFRVRLEDGKAAPAGL